MSKRSDELRRASIVFAALSEVLALAVSGEHPIPVVLEKFDQCASECLREIKESELRDPLETQISFLRGLIEVEIADSVVLKLESNLVVEPPDEDNPS